MVAVELIICEAIEVDVPIADDNASDPAPTLADAAETGPVNAASSRETIVNIYALFTFMSFLLWF